LIAEVIKGKLQTASREFTIYPGNAGESANIYIRARKIDEFSQNILFAASW
jgi:hypothetical protein